jgi:hypothetical protein
MRVWVDVHQSIVARLPGKRQSVNNYEGWSNNLKTIAVMIGGKYGRKD